jgi:hypothetical protein
MRVVLLTGSDLRHDFFRKSLALQPGIEVVLSICEATAGRIDRHVAPGPEGTLQRLHLCARDASARDFFGALVALVPDHSNPMPVTRGAVNVPAIAATIDAHDADALVAYGCSLVRGRLLAAYEGRFLNVHLGLSPYYRGSGTNFWPLVNGEPEFVGATFLHMDAGVDTGVVIHQMRAEVELGDSPASIGHRVISRMVAPFASIIRNLHHLEPMPQLPMPQNARYYREKDFSPDATRQLYNRFRSGLVERYIEERTMRVAAAPIIRNPVIVAEAPA